MHNEDVTSKQLAAELGIASGYLSQILNGKRHPPGARERLEGAFKTILERRKEEESV